MPNETGERFGYAVFLFSQLNAFDAAIFVHIIFSFFGMQVLYLLFVDLLFNMWLQLHMGPNTDLRL
jgi:hypothetical protein